jgi:hypothetical protein
MDAAAVGLQPQQRISMRMYVRVGTCAWISLQFSQRDDIKLRRNCTQTFGASFRIAARFPRTAKTSNGDSSIVSLWRDTRI